MTALCLPAQILNEASWKDGHLAPGLVTVLTRLSGDGPGHRCFPGFPGERRLSERTLLVCTRATWGLIKITYSSDPTQDPGIRTPGLGCRHL